MQTPGVDFNETYSPVVKTSSIKFILALSIKNNYNLFHLDVETAFFKYIYV